MVIAVMDLGTNTFHLVIATLDSKKLNILYKEKVSAKLGEDGITSQIISEKPFKRGVQIMKRFSRKIAEFEPAEIIATGTAAIRNAKNNMEFLEAVYKASGIKVRLIDGRKEAELICDGVRMAVPMTMQKSLIMDIGGGSVEFIIANDRKIFWKHSFELGGALLLEKFKPSDPITLVELKAIKSYLRKELKPLWVVSDKLKATELIGSSGSFDTFAEMIARNKNKHSILKNKTSMKFKMEEYFSLYEQLVFSTTAQRKKMKGLIAMRIDMIVIASIILTCVLEELKVSKMTLSTYALKEGILWRIMKNKKI